MKKIELEPTEENIKNTLSNDSIGRNRDLCDFLGILDSIEGNMSIAVDGDWGSGKTFFIKQAELLLSYFYNVQREDSPKDDTFKDVENIVSRDTDLSKIDLSNLIIPVYYNAWLYDDHNDPVLSIMYTIVKSHNIEHITQTKSGIAKNIGKILTSLAFLKGINFDFSNITDFESSSNLIDEIESMENIKTTLQEVFNEIINEHCDKLVIFIDELDRCNPKYAISVLERIKHFFQDDRIVFVYSTNKSQLVHTIKKHYGNDFDASGYLNKFFDFSMKLRDINVNQYATNFTVMSHGNTYFSEVAYCMIYYYNFSMRDCNRYLQMLTGFEAYLLNNNYLSEKEIFWIMVFVPIVFALRVSDIEKSSLFEKGKLFEELINIVNADEIIKATFRYGINFSHKMPEETPITEADIRAIYLEIFDIHASYNTSKSIPERGRAFLKRMLSIVKL